MIDFSLLGPVRGRHRDRELDLGSPQQRTVLAILLLHAGTPVTLTRLATALWGDTPPPAAPATVRTYISRLRQALAGTDVSITSSDSGYALPLPSLATDVAHFRRHTGLAAAATRAGAHATAAMSLRSALALRQGTILAGTFGPYTDAQRVRLQRLLRQAEVDRLHAEIRLGHAAYTAPDIALMLASEPLSEDLNALMMIALYASGCRAAALAHYHQFARHLRTDLGTRPGPAVTTVLHRLLTGDPELLYPVTPGHPERPVAAAS
ncbi:DNA-binding SARP family transcriptional activator [Catenuloplanes nepalensis]|uniref:DNA-binding SARP family transcriptional activator n=1 Tax=Catenuloplanes nepalensis TaxID=587533 RepID=A0ABT9MPT6_9ACTN|nr:BTAD domain-containing putative transcriptional regulator [Catenuloplanes nepalensis]MDP9793423.1 DNA-binding SARP family transcriptional activator [Catenuloplanes nepalensis]